MKVFLNIAVLYCVNKYVYIMNNNINMMFGVYGELEG